MPLTKRGILGFINSQYDPMGLICPLLIILKIKLRDLFCSETQLGSDDQIVGDLHERWMQIIAMFSQIGDIVIQRAVRPADVLDPPELIGFGDGSLLAYGCTIYVRWKKKTLQPTDPEEYVTSLVCRKG